MKKYTLIILFFVFSLPLICAQEFRKDVGEAKKLTINKLLGSINIKPSNEKQLRINVKDLSAPPKRADGLKPIYNNSVDNTGLGLEVKETDGTIYVSGASASSKKAQYTFFVPKHIAISIAYHSPFAHKNLVIEGLENEVEAKTLTANIFFKDLTGPLVLNSISGNIEGVFSKVNQENPSSISSVSGFVDVSLPSETTGNVSIKTLSGEAYTDFNITLEESKDENKRNLKRQISGFLSGKINGGGVKIHLESISGNVYMRKK